MSEVQSRFGIIEKLNNRKINEREKLANIERETDKTVYDTERNISMLKGSIAEEEKSYKQKHKDWVREQTLALELFKNDFQRDLDKLESDISNREANHEGDFQKFKASREREIAELKVNLDRYNQTQNKKIEEKKAILEEIESGISSLKEISKEQKD